jgi:hypothetical protein
MLSIVVSVLFVCCLIVVPLPPGENPFAVNNNNNNNNNNNITTCGNFDSLVIREYALTSLTARN